MQRLYGYVWIRSETLLLELRLVVPQTFRVNF